MTQVRVRFSLYLSLYNKQPPELSHFYPRGFTLNKLGRGSLDDATYININALGLQISDEKIFIVFPICLCETSDPWGGPLFTPGL